MSAQHKRPGRSARRRRQERALERRPRNDYELIVLVERTSQPLLPVPPKQPRRLVR
jgi:hypothetical protein